MELDWGYFRHLYEDLCNTEEHRKHLDREQTTTAQHLAELSPLRTKDLPEDDERGWQNMKLYGLSRISDYLIELYCPRQTAVRTDFLTGIGLTPFEHADTFSPFHQEIVAVVQDDTAPDVTVEDVLWPGFWFGDLLFSRAGVRVRAPRHLIDADVATTSTLYFTFRRGSRPTNDLSHGWGHNSQWRTRFPLFYSDQQGLHLNWGAEVDIGEDTPAPPAGWSAEDFDPLEQRRELLLHRCFVRGPLPPDENDKYPFHDRLTIKPN